MDIRIASHTLTSACGKGLKSLGESLSSKRSALQKNDYLDSHLETWIGRVSGLEEHQLPSSLQHLDSRNNRLSDMALLQDGFYDSAIAVRDRVGSSRVGIILGTSTSSVGKTESAYKKLDANNQLPRENQQSDVHNPHAPGHFVANRLGITGPSMTISTACSSSSKVFAAASRWLDVGLVDAVVVGGVDSLCLSILHGFASLELISAEQCRPFDAMRNGINIGEAAGFALLLPAHDKSAQDLTLALTGFGESSDAFHMAQPHPEGRGAALAMAGALKTSGLAKHEIGYINLHGTATKANDLAETQALAATFGQTEQDSSTLASSTLVSSTLVSSTLVSSTLVSSTLVSSTKGWTGHTLGAAGITGAVIALEAIKHGRIPGTLNLSHPDEALMYPILQDNADRPCKHAMANSFGFGGNNCSLIFSRVQH